MNWNGYAYDVPDTLPEPAFDAIAVMAARLFSAPISLVSLVDDQRQWFKAKCGFEPAETERDLSFCTHAMLEDRSMVVCDATKDDRFKNNPLVTGNTSFRFYVGAPIKTKEGLPLGSLCVIDTVPRDYPAQTLLDNIADLAFLVVEQLEYRAVAAAKLRAELRYKLIAEATHDLFLVIDESGVVLTVN